LNKYIYRMRIKAGQLNKENWSNWIETIKNKSDNYSVSIITLNSNDYFNFIVQYLSTTMLQLLLNTNISVNILDLIVERKEII
jgi:hypothetical protein